MAPAVPTPKTGFEKAGVIFNPTSGSGGAALVRQTIAELQKHGIQTELLETNAPGHGTTLAKNYAAENPGGLVLAAGGDGTICEIADALAGSSATLALLPTGTANVLAREIGLNANAYDIVQTVLFGTVKTLRPGLANGRTFLIMASAGYDARIVANVSLRLKSTVGKLAYVVQAVREMFSTNQPTLTVSIDGVDYKAATAIVCKGRLYGGPFVLAPDADLCAENFCICLMGGRGPVAAFRYAKALVSNSMHTLEDVHYIHGKQVRMTAAGTQPLHADGDNFGNLPAHITPHSKSLKLLFPPKKVRLS